jgi:hypothetical protein
MIGLFSEKRKDKMLKLLENKNISHGKIFLYQRNGGDYVVKIVFRESDLCPVDGFTITINKIKDMDVVRRIIDEIETMSRSEVAPFDLEDVLKDKYPELLFYNPTVIEGNRTSYQNIVKNDDLTSARRLLECRRGESPLFLCHELMHSLQSLSDQDVTDPQEILELEIDAWDKVIDRMRSVWSRKYHIMVVATLTTYILDGYRAEDSKILEAVKKADMIVKELERKHHAKEHGLTKNDKKSISRVVGIYLTGQYGHNFGDLDLNTELSEIAREDPEVQEDLSSDEAKQWNESNEKEEWRNWNVESEEEKEQDELIDKLNFDINDELSEKGGK